MPQLPHSEPGPITARSQAAYVNGLSPAEPQANLQCLPLPSNLLRQSAHCEVGTAPSTGRASSTRSASARASLPRSRGASAAWRTQCSAALTPPPTSACGPSPAMPARGTKRQAGVFALRLSLLRYMRHVLLERLEPSPQMRKKYGDVFESRATCGATLTPIRRGAESRPVLEGRMAEVHDFLLRMG